MKDKTQPEALRLANEFKLCNEYDSIPSMNDIAKAESELRRQHARIAELEADHFEDKLDMVARWYMVDKDGMATLCTDREDAEQEAKDADMSWPHTAPHRAVQLVEVGASAAELHPSPTEGMAGGWISVDERLPASNVTVLLTIDGKHITTGKYIRSLSCFSWNMHDDETDDSRVTHWMPLPTPPASTKGVEHG